MAVETPQQAYWRYLMAAFARRTRIPFLGDLPLNKMALAILVVLGLANPGFLFLGAAGELLYLFLRSTNPRFQKLIAAERLMVAQQSWGETVTGAVARLEAGSRERYRRLLGKCRLILGISESLDADSLGNFRDLRARSLNQLLGIFLRLLGSREAIVANLSGLDEAELESDIGRLEQRLEAAGQDTALARSLQGTLEIQRKRLENLHRARASLAVIDAELERIEQQVELIREESAVTGRPEQLSLRLDAVTSAMAETSRWMDEHADFFGSLGGEEATTLPDLPELPAVLEEEGEP
jgi:hypothetical protein